MIIKEIEEVAKKYFEGASGCHDWSHVERVKNLALIIGKKEKADLKILEIAVLLHDIGRKKEMELKNKNYQGRKYCHAIDGSVEAEKILQNFKLSVEEIDNIVHCVKTHRYRNDDKPESIEAKVLFDADKLDSIGAVGIARVFLFAGNAGSNCLYTGNEKRLAKTGKNYSYTKEDSAILEYEIKLKHIKKRMLTKTGKKIARERDGFMKNYFKQFWLEVNGKL